MEIPARSVIERILASGYQLSPAAFEALGRLADPDPIVDSLLAGLEASENPPLVIEPQHLEHAMRGVAIPVTGCPAPAPPVAGALPAAAGVAPSAPTAPPAPALAPVPVAVPATPAQAVTATPDAEDAAPPYPFPAVRPPPRPPLGKPGRVEVLSGSEACSIEGTIEDFKKHFINRFERLQKVLMERADVVGAVGCSAIPPSDKWGKAKVIGMVTSKREFKSGAVIAELEDPGGMLKITFGRDERLKHKIARLMIDEVVCVSGRTKGGRDLIVDDIMWPDVSERSRPRAGEEAYAVLTSDIHIGSKTFMRESFEAFIRWLRGENGSGRSKEVALKTKYLVIAGDLVDGVGIYPNQEAELSIKDLYKQYECAAGYLSMIPEDIQIVIIPGNHDACRPTLPTPPIYKDYAAPLYALKNVTMLGDPALVSLGGVSVLITHGRSLDDVIPSLPDCNFREPHKAMAELLKSRHLCPPYGGKTPIAPEAVDRLVIDPVPHIFHAGHVHVEGVSEYRGVVIANSGAWQTQTEYQLSMGIVPKPGIVPVVELSTFKTFELNFN